MSDIPKIYRVNWKIARPEKKISSIRRKIFGFVFSLILLEYVLIRP